MEVLATPRALFTLFPLLLGAASCREPTSDHAEPGAASSPMTGSAGTAAASLPAPPSRLLTVVEALRPGLYDCPDRVWPGLAAVWRPARILFTSRKANGAWLFAGGVVSRVDIATLGGEWFALFNNGELSGAPTLGIGLDEMDRMNDLDHTPGRPDFAIIITPHEAFHYFGQRSWRIDKVERRVRFPESWRPEFLRNVIVESVRAAARTSGGTSLGHASAYWHELRDQFGDEMAASRGLDVLEGSAEYATLMTLALADVGCDATDDVLRTAALTRVDALVRGKGPYRDNYDIGVVAGVLLHADGNAWTADVVRGTPPVDLLLRDVPRLPTSAHGDLVAQSKRTVAARNAKRAPVIEARKARLTSREQVRVVVSSTWIEGSFQSEAHIRLPAGTGVSTAYIDVHAQFATSDATFVRATGHVIAEGVANPCGIDNSWVLTVPTTSVNEAAGRFSASTDTVEFERLPAKRGLERHLTWLCAAAPTSR